MISRYHAATGSTTQHQAWPIPEGEPWQRPNIQGHPQDLTDADLDTIPDDFSETDLVPDQSLRVCTYPRFWQMLDALCCRRHFHDTSLPSFYHDTNTIDSDEPISKVILSFRNGARTRMVDETSVWSVIGTARPDLSTFFQRQSSSTQHTVWDWACNLAKVWEEFPLTLQLAIVFLAGIQMRLSLFTPDGR